MTIRELMIKNLDGNGMLPEQISAVMAAAMKPEAIPAMQGRWEDPVSEYLPSFPPVVWLHVRRIALAWIDANFPNAWFRAMFVDEQVAEPA